MRKNFVKYGIVASSMGLMILASACSSKKVSKEINVSETTAEKTGTDTSKENDSFKSGLAILTDISGSKNAEDGQNGLAVADSVVAALVLDKSGRIVDLKIDEAKTTIEFTKEGQLVTGLDTNFKSVKELGGEYGLKGASKIGKEWNEQVEAFESYAKGKTVEELKNISLKESGVTTKVDRFLEAVDKAATNSKDSKATEKDKVGLSIITKIDSSKSFEDGDDGVALIDSLYAMTSVGTDGKITSAIIDGTDTDIEFNDIGEITADFEDERKTKQELGEGYGMKAASSILKEWNEQADAIAEYVIGKTGAELEAIEVADDGKAKDVDLVSKATMAISPFKELLKNTIK